MGIRDAKAASPHTNHPLHWQVGAGPNAEWAVREGDWKLIGHSRDTSSSDGKTAKLENQLFNIYDDPGEKRDLAGQHPDILSRLRHLHEGHLQ